MNPARTFIQPHTKDLGGGFPVRRLLPSAQRQAVGPFLFLDHFGPLTPASDGRNDVRAHPHIGLATVSYLFEGAIEHRDSTGAVQRIEAGAVNWMCAGSGIVHSERMTTQAAGRKAGRKAGHKAGHNAGRLHGLQLWSALPVADEEIAPSFVHTPAHALPELELGGARVRLLLGEAFGARSPVALRSPTLMLDMAFSAGDAFPLPLASERAVYVVDGEVEIDGEPVPAHSLLVLASDEEPLISASSEARAVLLGGDSLGPRHIWWNFVSSRRERLRQAGQDWAAQRFDAVPGETEFIPLPGEGR